MLTQNVNSPQLVPDGQTCEGDGGTELPAHDRGEDVERYEDAEDGRDTPDGVKDDLEKEVVAEMLELLVACAAEG